MAWKCDSCKGDIVEVIDGILEWKNTREHKRYDLHLVHDNKDCSYNKNILSDTENATVSYSSLENYVGQDGLMTFLEEISMKDFLDGEEILEMIKRLHVEGYEEVRLYIKQAVSEGVYEPNTVPMYPMQSDIEQMRGWIQEKRADH
ncbi:hypothetical protein ACODHD_10955 [Vagococcus fluvialis]|uniref:hypothetical protein n=1 Tax=Vagococcus fluvialis TaxID=2738 RepID=UPI003B5AE5B7